MGLSRLASCGAVPVLSSPAPPPPHPTGLDVSHNVLGMLPDNLSGLQELAHLDCSHNHFASFPQVSSHYCWQGTPLVPLAVGHPPSATACSGTSPSAYCLQWDIPHLLTACSGTSPICWCLQWDIPHLLLLAVGHPPSAAACSGTSPIYCCLQWDIPHLLTACSGTPPICCCLQWDIPYLLLLAVGHPPSAMGLAVGQLVLSLAWPDPILRFHYFATPPRRALHNSGSGKRVWPCETN